MRTIAVTGATGFVGRHVSSGLRRAGLDVRALVRRDDPGLTSQGIVPVAGALEDEASLKGLVANADAVIHIAGTIHAHTRTGFMAANAAGAAKLADAAAHAGCTQLIHISSLAAREPTISPYAESKAAGEREVLQRAGRMRSIIVRPPAVWGPGDQATLPLLRGLAQGWLMAPRGGSHRFSLLHVHDLADLVAMLLTSDLSSGTVIEPDDGTVGGYGWSDLAGLAARQLQRKVRVVALHRGMFVAAAVLAERHAAFTGRRPVLTRAKVAELFHTDWVSASRSSSRLAGWKAKIDFADGLLPTLAWYRAAGWLGGEKRMGNDGP